MVALLGMRIGEAMHPGPRNLWEEDDVDPFADLDKYLDDEPEIQNGCLAGMGSEGKPVEASRESGPATVAQEASMRSGTATTSKSEGERMEAPRRSRPAKAVAQEAAGSIGLATTDRSKGGPVEAFVRSGPAPGEAQETSNDGKFSVISANITALRPRWEKVVGWPATVKAIQETRMGEEAQRVVE
jgi:hypothetical protein